MAKGKFNRLSEFGDLGTDSSNIISLPNSISNPRLGVMNQLLGLIAHHSSFALAILGFGFAIRHIHTRLYVNGNKDRYLLAGVIYSLFFLGLVNLIAGDIVKSKTVLRYLEKSTTSTGIPLSGSLVASIATYATTMQLCLWISDFYLMHRMYRAWNKPRILDIVLSILVFAELASGTMHLVLLLLARSTLDATLQRIGLSVSLMCALPVTPGIFVAFLVRGYQRLGWAEGNWYRVLVETGAPYAVMKLVVLAGLSSFAESIAGMLVSLTLITPCLIAMEIQPDSNHPADDDDSTDSQLPRDKEIQA